MKPIIKYSIVSLVFCTACFAWWLTKSELMLYHEQYQLFLFTGSYFANEIVMPGGLADYVSEFLTQFYLVPVLGALAIAILLTALQICVGATAIRLAADESKLPIYLLSCLPSIVIVRGMGDENLLLSYPTALLIAVAMALCALTLTENKRWGFGLSLIVGLPLAYWFAGPVAIVYAFFISFLARDKKNTGIYPSLSLAYFLIIIWVAGFIYVQYPYSQLALGINYYRATNVHPIAIYVGVALTILPAIIAIAFAKASKNAQSILLYLSAGAIVAGICCVPSGYDAAKMQILKYSQLVRQGKWDAIIARAEKEKPTSTMCIQAVNLALGKTGQLGDRMFEFNQNGINGLIGKFEYNNTANLITAETFYQLGMVNSALRYAFDTQEAIMNDRKSGRFMQRLAECMIINGNYDAAQRYLNLLKPSLYYSKWAKEAETYLGDEERINTHPVWGQKRRLRYKNNMLYDYPEIEKMLGILAIDSNGQNMLAWDYFNAATLLKGDLATFTGMYHYADEMFHISSIPKHHQEAIGMFWTFGHQSFDGIPFNISDATKSRITALAQTVMRNPNNPAAWQQFGDTYCVYFLKKQATKDATSQEKGSARGD